MFQSTEITLKLFKPLLWAAQIPVETTGVTPAQASVLTSDRAFLWLCFLG